jgi:hypothetical protein
MKKEMAYFQKLNKPIYYQKNKRKINHQKKSSDFIYDKSINNIYNHYYNTNIDFGQPYKRNQSPLPNNLNQNLPFRLNKLNDSSEKINFNFKNISSLFNIDLDNMIDLPDIKKEKILDFNIYSPLTKNIEDFKDDNSDSNINYFNFEENLSPLYRYGLRYINNDINNCINDRNDKIVFLQSCIRRYLLKKKLNINLLNKIYLERKNLNKILILQKNIRCFLQKLKIRKKIIINYIIQKRKTAINKIINKMRSYNNILKFKKYYFIKNTIKERNKYAKYIQETYRNFRFFISFKKLMKEINEKYCIIYPCKGNKIELIIYLEQEQKKYVFNYNKILKSFILFINPKKLYAGKYKCQFIIDGIVICDKNYPYAQYKNELYNIIELKLYKNKEKKKIKEKKEKNEILNKIIKNNKNIMNKNYNIYNEEDNNHNYYKYDDELEDIKEEEDEGKSTTSKDYLKKIKEYIDINDIDFTEEDIIKIKKMKGNNVINSDYKKLREELIDKNAICKQDKIRKNSFKTFKFNY